MQQERVLPQMKQTSLSTSVLVRSLPQHWTPQSPDAFDPNPEKAVSLQKDFLHGRWLLFLPLQAATTLFLLFPFPPIPTKASVSVLDFVPFGQCLLSPSH